MAKRVGPYVASPGVGIVKSNDKSINKEFKAESRSALKRARRGEKVAIPENLRK